MEITNDFMRDFFSKPHPVILFGYQSNKTLEQFLEEERKSNTLKLLNDTRKLVFIYRIAYAMKYIHSIGCFNCNLNSSSIVTDNNNSYPLFNVYYSLDKIINLLPGDPRYEISSYPVYFEQNNLKNQGFIDVKNFSIIMKEILTLKKPSEDDDDDDNGYYGDYYIIIKILTFIFRYFFKPKICVPKEYSELIERCSSENSKDRPTFSEIVDELRYNPSFITKDVNKEFFENFVRNLDEFPIFYDYKKDFLKEKTKIIKSNEIETYYNENSINSKAFISYLSKYDYIDVKVKYPTESFIEILNELEKLREKNIFSMNVIVEISSKINSLEDSFLSNRSIVTHVHLPNSLKSIGSFAFQNCISLIQIKIPNSITSIGDNCFEGCLLLSVVKFEDNSKLQKINKAVFKNCVSLRMISLPSSVTSIEFNSFFECKYLQKIETTQTKIYEQLLNYGLLFFEGEKVNKDNYEAFRLFRILAINGYFDAMFYYAYMLENGICCPTNVQKAFLFYMKAAEKNDPNSIYRLAVLFENGSGVRVNKLNALKFYEKAAAIGDERAKLACLRLKRQMKNDSDGKMRFLFKLIFFALILFINFTIILL